MEFPERIDPVKSMEFDIVDHLARYEYIKDLVIDKEILDCGCGNGYGSYYLSLVAKKVTAVDISDKAINFARNHYSHQNLEYKKMNVEDLDFNDDSFDVVVSFEVIEHLKNPLFYLKEIRRVLRESGTAYFSTPNRLIISPGSDTPLNCYHTKEYTVSEYYDLLTDYFDDVDLYGEHPDKKLKKLRSHTEKWRSWWHKLDYFQLREKISSAFRRKVLSNIIQVFTGERLESISQANMVFSKEDIEEAPNFFAIVK